MAQWAIFPPEGGWSSAEVEAAVQALIAKIWPAMQEAAAVLPVGATIRLLSEEHIAKLTPRERHEDGGAIPKAE